MPIANKSDFCPDSGQDQSAHRPEADEADRGSERVKSINASSSLRTSEIRYRRLFEAAKDGILILDFATRKITDANPFMSELLSYSHQELLGKELWEIGLLKDINGSQEAFRVLQENSFVRYENLPLQTRSGGRREVEFVSNVYEEDGRVVIQCNIRDITERKRMGAKLFEIENKYRTLFEHSPDGIVIANPQSYYLDANASTLQMLGYARDEFIGLHFSDIVMASAKEQIQPALEVIDAKSNSQQEWQLKRKDGSMFWGELMATTMPDGNLMAIIRDISERKKLEQQLRQSQKMEAIGQLCGGVAHDFNNILSVIMMQSELSGTVENLPHEVRDGLLQIRVAAERATSLTRQLLLFSSKQVMQPCEVDLNDVIVGVAKMLRRIIGEDVNLQLHLHSLRLITRADAGMLEQVLMNLAVNARDAMPGGGQLIIETNERTFTDAEAAANPGSKPGHHVGLRVTDAGCGIPPENLGRIFEPFFTTKEPGKGTGLGLATVFGIVKQHHGSIAVESEVGRGTSFQILLPS